MRKLVSALDEFVIAVEATPDHSDYLPHRLWLCNLCRGSLTVCSIWSVFPYTGILSLQLTRLAGSSRHVVKELTRRECSL